jgi:hypothetical protein
MALGRGRRPRGRLRRPQTCARASASRPRRSCSTTRSCRTRTDNTASRPGLPRTARWSATWASSPSGSATPSAPKATCSAP